MYLFALPDVGSTDQRAPTQKFDNYPSLYPNNRWTQCAVHPAIDGISIRYRYVFEKKINLVTFESIFFSNRNNAIRDPTPRPYRLQFCKFDVPNGIDIILG